MLRNLYNKCIKWEYYTDKNPAARFERQKESNGRVRYLLPDEELRLLSEADKPLRSLIIIGINTGLRVKSEALTLLWKQIDFQLNTVTVDWTFAKNRRTRAVPLNSIALDTLKRLKATTPGPWVFMTNKGSKRQGNKHWEQYKSFRTAFENACQRANLSDVTPHVLRHTFATRLVKSGVDLRTVQELGGWESIAMVQRYAHTGEEHKREAIERIANNFTTVFPQAPDGEIGETHNSSYIN